MRWSHINNIAAKELDQFFATPLGYLFLGAFLAISLFVFFWVEAFFARNIADVRPLFEWLPILLVFLSAALTMRMWSEERRTGTLEFVVTLPVSTASFVVGKFAACLILLCIALALTLPLPITVAMLGDLDWGPVFAGYLAAILLGAAYIAIGLFVSARSNSQIVSLIVASLLCMVFYLLGAAEFAGFFGGSVQSLLSSLGSGVRFESITRGMIDARDLYFYVSVAIAFLALNIYALERDKWAADGASKLPNAWRLGTGLLVLNVLLVNVWLDQITSLRIDTTQGRIYSLSQTSKNYLKRLDEPLLIRGYFSAQTHPLLAPLVPRMKDLLNEYEIHGGGDVRVELIDPADDPELESEANTKYGIRAVPFQVQDRHQAALVNSYFDVLIQYGDEFEVLSFRDLIEVKAQGEADLDVQLKNPEFDITRSIKQVLYGFQGGNSVFANIVDPVQFVGYISAARELPEPLLELQRELDTALDALSQQGGDKFSVQIVDPDAGNGEVALDIAERFGFQPLAASLFDERRFYFYLTLQNDQTVVQIPLPEDVSAESIQRGLEEGLKRFAAGLLKTVVFVGPEAPPPYMQQPGTPMPNQFTQLQGFLTGEFNLVTSDLSDGVVPAEADLLVVVDPSDFNDKQVYAIDQFLMKGGTVLLSSGAFAAQPSQGSLMAIPTTSGLEGWLTHHGLTVAQQMVMDPQNAAFPVPVTREVGGFSFQDLAMLDYPYFPDLREEGLNAQLPFFAGVPQITMSWVSPIKLNQASATDSVSAGPATTVLLETSPGSWLSSDPNVSPKVDEQGISGFVPTSETGAQVVGVMLEGRFESFFAGQESPLLVAAQTEAQATSENAAEGTAVAEDATDTAAGLGVIDSVIDRSAESARLILFSSNDFLADQTIQMVGSASGTLYLNSVQLVANMVDWATEDDSLVGIRARGNFNRTLPGLDPGQQSFLEWLNYGLALLGVFIVMFVFRRRAHKTMRMHQEWLPSE